MNNEPVAWISNTTLQNLQMPFLSQVTHRISVKANTMDEFTIPLYTTPQTTTSVVNAPFSQVVQPITTPQITELSDEEMRKVINENVENVTVSEMVMFLTVARAILKKASEK